MDLDEGIRQIVESREPLTRKALRIADIEGSVDFKRIRELFKNAKYNTLTNLLPQLKRQRLLTKDGQLTDKGLQAVLPSVTWESLYLLDVPGKETALRYMEPALKGLSSYYKDFVRSYLIRILCNLETFDPATNSYRPGNSHFRRGTIISDVVKKYREDDRILPELYAALQLLPPDGKTAHVLGEYLLRRVSKEDGLRALTRMSGKQHAESAFGRRDVQ